MKISLPTLILPALMLCMVACDQFKPDADTSYPDRVENIRKESRGKLTGDGLSLGGSDSDEGSASNNPLGVNSFLWRATLDTLAFMPFASADPFGGVIITDWYEDPKAQGERFKVNALILDRQLRADGIKISLFKQSYDTEKGWQDMVVEDKLERELEDTILTRARELRVKSTR